VIYRPSPTAGQLFQSEIVSNLVQARLNVGTAEPGHPPVVDFLTHPYAVVLTQDCDLESDYLLRSGERTTGARIPSVLFCEVTDAEAFKSGADIRADIWRRVRANKDERYHYLRAVSPDADAARQGTPNLALDFKRHFTIPTDEVYQRLASGELRRRACLESPYREHLATRFFYYHHRVALPEDHFVQPPST
jgi:hypothetical protein